MPFGTIAKKKQSVQRRATLSMSCFVKRDQRPHGGCSLASKWLSTTDCSVMASASESVILLPGQGDELYYGQDFKEKGA